jgi:hypothetical protein
MGKDLVAVLLLLLSGAVSAMPEGALRYAPVLAEKQKEVWPEAPEPWTIAGQIEAESCITLWHLKCWNPRVELKTYREYGFGLGQITVTYRFNKFEELRTAHDSLQNWTWENRFDAGYQLLAIVEMDRGLYNRVQRLTDDPWAFTLSAYNGGLASLLRDRTQCLHTEGCNPRQWFGHVERTSLKSKVPQKAYGGRSWFEINRNYVRGVLRLRRDKYKIFWE